MQKIYPNLWFDDQAEVAANYYVSIFKNSKILNTSHYGQAGQEISGQEPGTVMTVAFELEGQRFLALNGGPHFKFTEAISLVVDCETQAEIDEYWGKLSAVPESEECGWLKDKFGLSWQIVPARMGELMSNPATTEAVMAALLKMKKLDLAALEAAAGN